LTIGIAATAFVTTSASARGGGAFHGGGFHAGFAGAGWRGAGWGWRRPGCGASALASVWAQQARLGDWVGAMNVRPGAESGLVGVGALSL
jgi:hypothetical protein